MNKRQRKKILKKKRIQNEIFIQGWNASQRANREYLHLLCESVAQGIINKIKEGRKDMW